ncbi:hypothetical protein KC347_g117 [Hortaea werneckii]|nr:hypothetical protein KC347_g117 [Hortaea werneckii]
MAVHSRKASSSEVANDVITPSDYVETVDLVTSSWLLTQVSFAGHRSYYNRSPPVCWWRQTIAHGAQERMITESTNAETLGDL